MLVRIHGPINFTYKRNRKSGYVLGCFFLFLPLFYLIANIIYDSFEVLTFVRVLVMALSIGIGISPLGMTGDYFNTEKLKRKLATIDLHKIGAEIYNLSIGTPVGED